MRKKVIVGNWKMNHTSASSLDYLASIKEAVNEAKPHGIVLGIAPSFLQLDLFGRKKPAGLILAAQNVNDHESGAYTGEVDLDQLLEVKHLTHVIIGHSERRQYYNETSTSCNAKMKLMATKGLYPIYCVGETLAQFEANETKKVVQAQIIEGLAGLDAEYVAKTIIAYEPVWSIGTGKNASKEIAQDVCHYIRQLVAKLYGRKIANKVIIQYGGSVKPHNVKEYLTQPDIDGALVGGASLKVDSFRELVSNLYN